MDKNNFVKHNGSTIHNPFSMDDPAALEQHCGIDPNVPIISFAFAQCNSIRIRFLSSLS